MRITVDELRFLMEQAHKQFELALAYDGMPYNTKFAEFSKNNPHAKIHAKMMPRILKFNALLTKWRLACKSV